MNEWLQNPGAWVLLAPVGYFGLKFLLPFMKQMMDANITNSRTESGLLRQVSSERDKAILRAEAAERRADELFKKVVDLESKITIMGFQQEESNRRLDEATQLIKQMQQRIAELESPK